jgi:hypothetical protein
MMRPRMTCETPRIPHRECVPNPSVHEDKAIPELAQGSQKGMDVCKNEWCSSGDTWSLVERRMCLSRGSRAKSRA